MNEYTIKKYSQPQAYSPVMTESIFFQNIKLYTIAKGYSRFVILFPHDQIAAAQHFAKCYSSDMTVKYLKLHGIPDKLHL